MKDSLRSWPQPRQTPPRRRRDTLLRQQPRTAPKTKMLRCLHQLPRPRAPTQLAAVPPQARKAQTQQRSLLTQLPVSAAAPPLSVVTRAGLRSRLRRRTTMTSVLQSFLGPSGRPGSLGRLGEVVDLLMTQVAVVAAGVVVVVEAAAVTVLSGASLATPTGSESM